MHGKRVLLLCLLAASAAAQSSPSREYIRLGSRVVAVENPQGVATPTFSEPGGTYGSSQTIYINTAPADATINYTTDASMPSENHGMPYTGSVTISSTTTLKAIAYKTGMLDSGVASATYTITPPETVSTPYTPSGATSVTTGDSNTYSTGGSADNLGYSVQYRFVWGDGQDSGWLSVGTTSASHVWSADGTYSVTAYARSAAHQNFVSAQSPALSVTAETPPPTYWATYSISDSATNVGQNFTVSIRSNMPNSTFGVHVSGGGIPDWQDDFWGTTDGSGSRDIVLTAPDSLRLVGTWTEYVYFQGYGVDSNTIQWTLNQPYVYYMAACPFYTYYCDTYVGYDFWIAAVTNIYNHAFDLWVNDGFWRASNYGSTNSNGHWTLGPLQMAEGNIGSFTEQLVFHFEDGDVFSNTLPFTVHPAQ